MYTIITTAIIVSMFVMFAGAKITANKTEAERLNQERTRRNNRGQYLHKVRVNDFINNTVSYFYL
jgi:hypothetical protein